MVRPLRVHITCDISFGISDVWEYINLCHTSLGTSIAYNADEINTDTRTVSPQTLLFFVPRLVNPLQQRSQNVESNQRFQRKSIYWCVTIKPSSFPTNETKKLMISIGILGATDETLQKA